eukprot:796810_1
MHPIKDNEAKYNDKHSMEMPSLQTSELISITIDGEAKLIDKCLLDCPQLQHLKTIIDTHCDTKNNFNVQNIDRNGMKHILNYYHEILHVVRRVDNLEYIYHYLGGSCDITTCKRFNRLYMLCDERRPQNQTKPSTNNIVDVVATQIIDKMHSHFSHSFDMGSRSPFHHRDNVVRKLICQRRRRYTNFSTSLFNRRKCITTEASHERYYDFGYAYYYGYKGEQNHEDSVAVSPKHSSLKEELLQNYVATLSAAQFNDTYQKCAIHFKSKYNHKLRNSTKQDMAYEHIFAILAHCNYDLLQSEFNKTYRKHDENESMESTQKRHSSFYYFGYYLKQIIHFFGTKISEMRLPNGEKQVFYNGINGELLFRKYIGHIDGVRICCPLSTTSEFCVATQFASNGARGMVITFVDDGRRYFTPKTFSCRVFSNFSNEDEYLFIQNSNSLHIKSICNVISGVRFDLLLQILYILNEITVSPDNIVGDIAKRTKEVMYKLIA